LKNYIEQNIILSYALYLELQNNEEKFAEKDHKERLNVLFKSVLRLLVLWQKIMKEKVDSHEKSEINEEL
jgi:hypothetical protein